MALRLRDVFAEYQYWYAKHTRGFHATNSIVRKTRACTTGRT